MAASSALRRDASSPSGTRHQQVICGLGSPAAGEREVVFAHLAGSRQSEEWVDIMLAAATATLAQTASQINSAAGSLATRLAVT